MNVHQPIARGGWTEQRIADLIRLHAEGFSASQIAAELGGVTRNSVIGKIHRLKLPRTGRRPGMVAKPAAPKPIPAARALRGKGQPKAPAIQHRLANPVVLAAPAAAEDGVDVTHLLGIMQLTDRTCKYPHGDPKHEDFGFCGKPPVEGSPYCLEHSRLCFSPAGMASVEHAWRK